MSRHKTGRLPYWVIEIDLFVIQLSVEAMHISIYETDLIYSDASDFPILVGKSMDDTVVRLLPNGIRSSSQIKCFVLFRSNQMGIALFLCVYNIPRFFIYIINEEVCMSRMSVS